MSESARPILRSRSESSRVLPSSGPLFNVFGRRSHAATATTPGMTMLVVSDGCEPRIRGRTIAYQDEYGSHDDLATWLENAFGGPCSGGL